MGLGGQDELLGQDPAAGQGDEQSVADRLLAAAKAPPQTRTRDQILEIAEFLLSVPKLRKFQPSTAAELAAYVGIRIISPEEYIFMQGDKPDAYYVLVSGKCALYIREDEEDGLGRETKTLKPKDGIGESELMEETLRPWSCKAVDFTQLLVVEASVFMRVLSGGFIRERQDKVNFLASLPQFKGMTKEVLSRIAHCFHEKEFEPKEIVVRQGQPSRHLFVIKSGQVSVFVDPDYDCSSPHNLANTDPKNCMQVCLLGGGTFIGDMSLDGSRRAATVIALHAVVTYKVRRLEFKKIMPPETVLHMRRVAEEKARFQKEHMARTAAPLRDTILLGKSKIPVPKTLLRGYGLRRLGQILSLEYPFIQEQNWASPRKARIPRSAHTARVNSKANQRYHSDQPEIEASTCPQSSTTVEKEIARAMKNMCPIRTILGHDPLPKFSNVLISTPQIRSARSPIHDSQRQDTNLQYSPRTSLVPLSPRSPRRPWSSPRDNLQGQRAMAPVLRSSLISPTVIRPTTAQGRSHRKCTVSSQEGDQHKIIGPVTKSATGSFVAIPLLKLSSVDSIHRNQVC